MYNLLQSFSFLFFGKKLRNNQYKNELKLAIHPLMPEGHQWPGVLAYQSQQVGWV